VSEAIDFTRFVIVMQVRISESRTLHPF
jgi:hypothetical protein